MNRRFGAGLIMAVLLLLVTTAYYIGGVRPAPSDNGNLSYVELPEGFEIEVFADGNFSDSSVSYPGPNPGPRFMAVHKGTLFVTIPGQDRVVAMPDSNRDGEPDRYITVLDGLNRPHGIDFRDDRIYIANTGSVVRYDMNGLNAEEGSREVLIDDIPEDGLHWTRTLQIHNDQIYVSAGSDCNICEADRTWRTKIRRCELDGSNCTTYASGLRNAVGFVFQNGTMFATENGRDNLGNDLPPDEINIVTPGGDYGYPYCYGDNKPDPEFNDETRCTDKDGPALKLQAHSAPLGLAFEPGNWPEEYRGDMYVAYHGSWNRQPPTGYKVVRINYDDGELDNETSDFAEGWLQDSTVLGRPVDMVFDQHGNMYVSDDNTGRIYRIRYTG